MHEQTNLDLDQRIVEAATLTNSKDYNRKIISLLNPPTIRDLMQLPAFKDILALPSTIYWDEQGQIEQIIKEEKHKNILEDYLGHNMKLYLLAITILRDIRTLNLTITACQQEPVKKLQKMCPEQLKECYNYFGDVGDMNNIALGTLLTRLLDRKVTVQKPQVLKLNGQDEEGKPITMYYYYIKEYKKKLLRLFLQQLDTPDGTLTRAERIESSVDSYHNRIDSIKPVDSQILLTKDGLEGKKVSLCRMDTADGAKCYYYEYDPNGKEILRIGEGEIRHSINVNGVPHVVTDRLDSETGEISREAKEGSDALKDRVKQNKPRGKEKEQILKIIQEVAQCLEYIASAESEDECIEAMNDTFELLGEADFSSQLNDVYVTNNSMVIKTMRGAVGTTVGKPEPPDRTTGKGKKGKKR